MRMNALIVALFVACAPGGTPNGDSADTSEMRFAITPLASIQAAVPAGSFLNEQVLTGVGIYVPTPGTTTARVRQQGAGGGGGGVSGGTGVAGAGGGNSGFYLEYIVEITTGGAYSVGAGGAGGIGTGVTGGDTTFTPDGSTYVAKGGTGGGLGVKGSFGITGPLQPAPGSTPVSIVTYGEGGLGFWSNTFSAASGKGGASPLGAGGFAVGVNSSGVAGVRGGGGGGAASNSTAIGGRGGDGLIVVDEYSVQAPVSADPCTVATLTSPSSSFSIALGASVALSATSECPTSKTPEFEFWVKRLADAQWSPTMLGGYGSASSTTFTPPTSGTWCVSVAVRAVGALDAVQVQSSAVCGSVGGAALLQPQTVVVPIAPPTVTGPALQISAIVSGSGSAVRPLIVPLPTIVGSTMTAIRARVTDSTVGPTAVHIQLADTTDDAEGFSIVATSSNSTGSGTEQTIVLPLAQVVVANHQYVAIVSPAAGSAPSSVWRLEMDVE